jgi:hypothetical protein
MDGVPASACSSNGSFLTSTSKPIVDRKGKGTANQTNPANLQEIAKNLASKIRQIRPIRGAFKEVESG